MARASTLLKDVAALKAKIDADKLDKAEIKVNVIIPDEIWDEINDPELREYLKPVEKPDLEMVLFPKQARAFLTIAREVLYGGAAGAGKSHLFRVAALKWCADIPGLQVYLFRREYSELFSNHMEGPNGFINILADLEERKLVKVNTGDNEIRFANGSNIFLRHVQHEKDVKKYLGAEIHLLIIDEATTFTDKIYRFLRNRLRMAGLKVPEPWSKLFPRILAGTNPGGVGHLEVKARWIDSAPPMEIKKAPKLDGGMTRQFIPANLDDNPAIVDFDPEYEDRLEGLGDAELVKAYRYGAWDIAIGAYFADVWDRDKIVLPFFDVHEVAPSWRLDRSFDWGSAKPSAAILWAEADGTEVTLPGGRLFCPPRGSLIAFAEYYSWTGKPNEGNRELAVESGRNIKALEKALGVHGLVRPGPADNAIFDTENGNNISDDMAKVGIKWTRSDKRPGSRVNGWQIMRRMMKMTMEGGEEAHLYFMENCTHCIRTLPALPRDEKKWDDIDSNTEDHAGDSIRYRVLNRANINSVKKLGGLDTVGTKSKNGTGKGKSWTLPG